MTRAQVRPTLKAIFDEADAFKKACLVHVSNETAEEYSAEENALRSGSSVVSIKPILMTQYKAGASGRLRETAIVGIYIRTRPEPQGDAVVNTLLDAAIAALLEYSRTHYDVRIGDGDDVTRFISDDTGAVTYALYVQCDVHN